MTKGIIEIIREIGAADGDLIYVRSSSRERVPGAISTSATDLLGLKVQAVESQSFLVATGPATDESFADFVIDANGEEPKVIKGRTNGTSHGQGHAD